MKIGGKRHLILMIWLIGCRFLKMVALELFNTSFDSILDCLPPTGALMTGFKLMVTLQSGCVIKIPTLCRMNKIFLKKYHEKENIHSFPTLYNTMGSKVNGLAVRSNFIQKNALKTAI